MSTSPALTDALIEEFHLVCYLGSTDDMTAMLTQTPELIEALSEDGLTPLCAVLAADIPFSDAAEKVALLLAWGADINGRSYAGGNSGFTPLMEAAVNGQVEAVALLLERGADLEAVDDEGYIALVHAHVPLLTRRETTQIIVDMIEAEPRKRRERREQEEKARQKDITDYHSGIERSIAAPARIKLQPAKRGKK